MIILKKPKNGEKTDLLTGEQREFLAIDRSDFCMQSFDYLNLKREGKKDFSFPEPVRFEWEAEGESILQISENESFEFCYSVKGKGFCDFYNLKSDTRYFWRVMCKNEISDTYFFDTKDELPRVIKIDGLTNIRDCGGWKIADGKRIRQGLLYRGSEMNSHVNITEDGLKTMRETLKIKSVLDLRGKAEIVEDVYKGKYVNIAVGGYADFFGNPVAVREIFEFLFEEENYPLYFHCWGGADRTGTVAFLAGAVLGMSYEDLLDDYEFTSLSVWGARSRNTEEHFKKFYEILNSYEGNTLKEKTENYLISCGVTKASIEEFRDFMICR